MSYFNDVMTVVLEHEGFDKISDHPADPGGITKWGISLRFLQKQAQVGPDGFMTGDLDKDGDIDADDIRGMTKSQALVLYREQFWNRYGYEAIAHYDIALKVMDLSVNMGPVAAHTCVQRCSRATQIVRLTEDGVLGPKTLDFINMYWSRGLIAALRSEAAGRYRLLAAVKPSNQVFLNGWLNRAYF